MAPPVQGFRYTSSLSAAASDKTGALFASCGASRGGGVQISGTWSGTVVFEQSLDSGATWIAKTVYPALGGAGVTSATANGQWKFACGGETHIRARCSVYTTGPIVVDATFTAGLDETVIGTGTAGSPSGGVQSVQGFGYASTVSLTRTNDTNAYTANDVVGAATGSTSALTFMDIGPPAGGEVFLTTVRFEIDIAAVISGMTSFRLYLYGATPPSALGDNAAWDLPSGDRASFKGYIDLGMPIDLGSTLYVETAQINKQIAIPAGGALYGYLVTNGGYTPAASSVFNIVLHSVGV